MEGRPSCKVRSFPRATPVGPQSAQLRRPRQIWYGSNTAEGALVFAKACEMGLEGIVSKRLGGVYWSGR